MTTSFLQSVTDEVAAAVDRCDLPDKPLLSRAAEREMFKGRMSALLEVSVGLAFYRTMPILPAYAKLQLDRIGELLDTAWTCLTNDHYDDADKAVKDIYRSCDVVNKRLSLDPDVNHQPVEDDMDPDDDRRRFIPSFIKKCACDDDTTIPEL